VIAAEHRIKPRGDLLLGGGLALLVLCAALRLFSELT
jgi:hypothetical protein